MKRMICTRSPFALAGMTALVWILSSTAAGAAPFSDVDPGLSSVTATPASGALADGNEEVTIEVVVRDSSGQPLADQIVRLASSNPADMIAQPVAPTDAQGVAIATLASEVHGARVVWATVDPEGESIELDAQPAVSFAEPPVRPNVLIILVDDIGTDSLSMFDEVNPYQSDIPYVHGAVGNGDVPDNGAGTSNLYIHSPNIQKLADEGITFLNAYAMPVCSPTRAALLTGNYPVRTGVGAAFRTSSMGGTLNDFGDPGFESLTLAEVAQTAGYADIHIGKWHLGMPTGEMFPSGTSSPPAPPNWAVLLGWSTIPWRGKFTDWISVFSNLDVDPQPQGMPDAGMYRYYLSRNETDHSIVKANPETVFATTLQFDEALTWCNTRTQPFVCVLASTAAHSPWDELPPMSLTSTDEYRTTQPNPPFPPLNTWTGQMAQIEALDTKIGDLVDGLLPAVRANTTIILMSDNGIPKVCLKDAEDTGPSGSGKDLGATYDVLLDDPTNRFKGSPYEKGVRVPMIVAGYGVVNPGRVSTALVDVTDVFPTVAEILQQPLSTPIHGTSFMPILEDQVDYHTHARDFTYSELFSPLGSTGAGATLNEWLIGCSLIIQGQGRYKIVHDADQPDADKFYKLQDANGDFRDPFETVELDYDPGDPERVNYLEVLTKMNEIIATGANAGPQTCATSVNFCDSLDNSTGYPAIIDGTGPCSVSLNQYKLRAEPVPSNQFGIFFYAADWVSGGAGIPYGEGLRCVGGMQVFRLGITTTMNEVLETPLDFMNLPPGSVIEPNSTWYFQAWYRDPMGGSSGFNLSDGLQTTFGS